MTSAIETVFHAFGAWLDAQGIGREDISLVIRCKDESTRSRLDRALVQWQTGFNLFQPLPGNVTLKTSPFKCYGVKVNVSSITG